MKIEAVIFDMDGLLIDSEKLWQEAEIEIFAKYGVKLTPEMCLEVQGMKLRNVIEKWYNTKPWENFSLLNVEKEIVSKVRELILEKGNLMLGVEYILNFFKTRNIPITLASGSNFELIDIVLDKFKIRDFFIFIHSAEKELHGKPFPDIFLTVAKKIGINPENCLVFEDSINGIIAAKKAGMKSIAIPYPENFSDSNYEIADLKLNSLLEFTEEIFMKFA